MNEKLHTLWEVSRPAVAPGVPLITLLGMAAGAATSNAPLTDLPMIVIIQLLLLSLPLNIILYGINDVYDYESDRRNKHRSGGWGTVLSPKLHSFVQRAAAAAAALLLLSAFFSGSIVNLLLILSMIVLAYLYSVPPVRLKVRPPLDSLVNGFGYFFLPFTLGFTYFSHLSHLPEYVPLVALAVAGGHAYSTLRDRSADAAVGDSTIGVYLGHRLTAILSAAAQLPALGHWLLRESEWQPTAFFTIAFLVMFGSAFLGEERFVKTGVKVIVLAGFFLVSSMFVPTI